jgi:pimeloyl-ACP methyl ester carboxylesterase
MRTRLAQTYLQTRTEVIRTVDGVDFAYRRMGSGGDVPLVLGSYFASNMDDWDPLIIDGLAADRELIAFDYPGIRGSTGITSAGFEST